MAPPLPGKLRLLQNILDALETRRQRLEIFRRPHGLNGDEPLFDIHQVVPAGSQHGIDFVIFEAANVFEVVADAVEEEIFELGIAVQ